MPEHALRIRSIEGQTGEELGSHAAAAAGVERTAGAAGAGVGGFSQRGEQLGGAPDGGEPAGLVDGAGLELVVQHERAGVHIADRVDEAHHATGAAQVETGQRFAERGEVEERVAGEHMRAGEQPVVELDLLGARGMQLMPGVDAATGGTEPGETQLGAVLVRQCLVGVDLFDVLAGHDHRQLELTEIGIAQMVHGGAHPGVGALAAHGVVGVLVDTVERDLDVDVVHGGEALGVLGVDAAAVGGELHAHTLGHAVLDDLEEVGAQHGFTAADVHVEHLHLGQLIDHGLHLFGGELVGIAPAGGRQAVHALQIAGVGPFPGETDGRVEPGGELIGESGHVSLRRWRDRWSRWTRAHGCRRRGTVRPPAR